MTFPFRRCFLTPILAVLSIVVYTALPCSAKPDTADSSLSELKKRGVLRVAVDTSYPPMEFEDDRGKPDGFDVDFAKKLAEKLGVQAEFTVMAWDGILAGLTSGRYDVIISSMNITKERERQADFIPYLEIAQVFVIKPGSVLAESKDLAGKIVAVQADTTSHEAVENFKKSGIPIKEIKAFRNATEAFLSLQSKQAEAIVIDEPVGLHYALNRPAEFIVSGRALKPEPIGIAMPKGKDSLRKALAEAVASLKKDGSMRDLGMKWFGADLSAIGDVRASKNSTDKDTKRKESKSEKPKP